MLQLLHSYHTGTITRKGKGKTKHRLSLKKGKRRMKEALIVCNVTPSLPDLFLLIHLSYYVKPKRKQKKNETQSAKEWRSRRAFVCSMGERQGGKGETERQHTETTAAVPLPLRVCCAFRGCLLLLSTTKPSSNAPLNAGRADHILRASVPSAIRPCECARVCIYDLVLLPSAVALTKAHTHTHITRSPY